MRWGGGDSPGKRHQAAKTAGTPTFPQPNTQKFFPTKLSSLALGRLLPGGALSAPSSSPPRQGPSLAFLSRPAPLGQQTAGVI